MEFPHSVDRQKSDGATLHVAVRFAVPPPMRRRWPELSPDNKPSGSESYW